MSPYETLGIPPNSTAADAKRAYRKKASKAHPDRGGEVADMQKLNKALAIVSDPARRAKYDANPALSAVDFIDVFGDHFRHFRNRSRKERSSAQPQRKPQMGQKRNGVLPCATQ